jgi:hypothetical protein
MNRVSSDRLSLNPQKRCKPPRNSLPKQTAKTRVETTATVTSIQNNYGHETPSTRTKFVRKKSNPNSLATFSKNELIQQTNQFI